MKKRTLRAGAVRGKVVAVIAAMLWVAPAAQATFIPYDPVSGFDEAAALALGVDYMIDTNWAGAGDPDLPPEPGFPAVDIGIDSCEFVDGSSVCSSTQAANATGPWQSTVQWDLTNLTEEEGPVLLFLSGLDPFDPPLDNYDPANVGILSDSADFVVAKLSMEDRDYYYLGFLVTDFSEQITFTYQVNEDIIEIETDMGGTPQMFVNAHFNPVPEPSATALMLVGLAGLATLGRRRAH